MIISVVAIRQLFCGLLLCLPLIAQAADFKLEDVQGKIHHGSDYRGKWVLVNFWATWCPPCLHEIPELINLHKTHQDLVIIGIAMQSGSKIQVVNFARKQGINYPIVMGSRRVVEQIGRVKVLPTSYLYSPNGVLVASQSGEVTQFSIENYIKTHTVR
ncbi:MAG: TlpA disulfide reductase family protein [Gallionella sp.]